MPEKTKTMCVDCCWKQSTQPADCNNQPEPYDGRWRLVIIKSSQTQPITVDLRDVSRKNCCIILWGIKKNLIFFFLRRRINFFSARDASAIEATASRAEKKFLMRDNKTIKIRLSR